MLVFLACLLLVGFYWKIIYGFGVAWSCFGVGCLHIVSLEVCWNLAVYFSLRLRLLLIRLWIDFVMPFGLILFILYSFICLWFCCLDWFDFGGFAGFLCFVMCFVVLVVVCAFDLWFGYYLFWLCLGFGLSFVDYCFGWFWCWFTVLFGVWVFLCILLVFCGICFCFYFCYFDLWLILVWLVGLLYFASFCVVCSGVHCLWRLLFFVVVG